MKVNATSNKFTLNYLHEFAMRGEAKMIVLRSRAMGTKRMGFRKDRFAKRMAASARSQAEFSRLVKERTGVTVSQTHLSHIIVGKKLPSLGWPAIAGERGRRLGRCGV